MLFRSLIVTVVRRYRAGSGEPTPALRILEERFARGEINKQEFEERRATLSR